jgi:signal transduction histidine kinase
MTESNAGMAPGHADGPLTAAPRAMPARHWAAALLSPARRAALITGARFLVALLAALRRAAMTAARPAARAWLRPSLRRRVGVALAVMSVSGFVVVAGSLETIFNINNHGYNSCGGPQGFLPALPDPGGYCHYSAPVSVLGIITMVAMIALLIWGWWLLAGWALNPLRATAGTVRRLGPQNLGQRIGLGGGSDQFKELADAIDDALDRLAAGYESQRRFAANASHELRTPLAVQRILTEVAMDDPAAGADLRRLGAQLLRTSDHHEQLIEGMLTLAESDRGLQGKVPVRLDEVARKVIGQHEELAGRAQITLRGAHAETTIPGDAVLLERLVANLIGNAIKYNEPGGWIETEVRPGPDGTGGTLVVRNTGARVPAEAVPVLFEPFRRLGADRVSGKGGVGLGLAIVRSIVTAHHATLQAIPRQPGGLEISIDFPAKGTAREPG